MEWAASAGSHFALQTLGGEGDTTSTTLSSIVLLLRPLAPPTALRPLSNLNALTPHLSGLECARRVEDGS
jgi:hypothetical protein